VTVTDFSDRFTLTNMTGQMDPYLAGISAASAGQPGPARIFMCGTIVCNASVALAGLNLTSASDLLTTPVFSSVYTSVYTSWSLETEPLTTSSSGTGATSRMEPATRTSHED